MKRATLVVGALALLCGGGGQAKAGLITTSYNYTPPLSGYSGNDPLFTFTYSDAFGNSAHGTVDATDQGNGTFLATSGILIVDTGAAAGTYSLLPGGPGITNSPSGAFLIDNLVYGPGNSSLPPNQSLDVYGLLFGTGGVEINLWGNAPNNYSFYAFAPGRGYFVTADGGNASIQAAPEPSSLAMLGMATVTLAGYCGWRRKQNPLAAV